MQFQAGSENSFLLSQVKAVSVENAYSDSVNTGGFRSGDKVTRTWSW